MSADEKYYDLPRIRWISALLISFFAPILSIMLFRGMEEPKMFMQGNWWLSWVAIAVYCLICVSYYNVDPISSARKDALIPAKRHAFLLLVAVPPTVILYELFLSNDALTYP